jgi:hypothetical protein
VEKDTETIIGSTILLQLPTKTVRNRKKVQVVEKWRGNTSLLDAGWMSSEYGRSAANFYGDPLPCPHFVTSFAPHRDGQFFLQPYVSPTTFAGSQAITQASRWLLRWAGAVFAHTISRGIGR